jgi:hypothetical protein
MRPVVPGTTAPTTIATIHVDRLVRLDTAQVAIRRDATHDLYTVEAAVPLKELGIDPKGAASLRGDVGVVFADESGRSRSLRLYYYNHHTETVFDVPTEATLQPAEWGPIVVPLGRNLLRNGGFEQPLVESREEAEHGWFVVTAQNGSGAVLSGQSPHRGRRSLLLETTTPVTFPPTAYEAIIPTKTRSIREEPRPHPSRLRFGLPCRSFLPGQHASQLEKDEPLR